MRPHDANARASVRSPDGRTHAATVTSLLGTPGFQPPGTDGDAHATRCRFCGHARSTLRHPSGRQRGFAAAGRLHPRRGVRPADRGLRPRAAARQVPRARRRPRRRDDPLRGQGQPGAGGGRGDRRARRALRLRLARRDRPLPGARRAGEPHRLRQHDQARGRHRPCPRRGRGAVRRRRRGGAAQARAARAGRAGDPAHAGRGERGRLAAQPQVRLLAPRGAAADGPRPVARARRRRHLVPRRQPDARAGDVGGRARRGARALGGRPRRPATACASSTSAAASRPSTASRCRRPRTMRRR